MMNKQDFTIDQIHNIRYENYEKTKELSHLELIEYTRKDAEEGRRILELLRLNTKKVFNAS